MYTSPSYLCSTLCLEPTISTILLSLSKKSSFLFWVSDCNNVVCQTSPRCDGSSWDFVISWTEPCWYHQRYFWTTRFATESGSRASSGASSQLFTGNHSASNYNIASLTVDKKIESKFAEIAWINNELVFKNETFEELAKKWKDVITLKLPSATLK